MPDAFPPPLSSLDPDQWRVYADWLEERHPDRRHASRRAERARRIAGAVAAGVRLVLAQVKTEWHGGGVLFALHDHWRRRRRPWYSCRWHTKEWLKRGYLGGNTNKCLSTPADFPGLVSEAPHLAWAFFVKAARTRAREEKEAPTP